MDIGDDSGQTCFESFNKPRVGWRTNPNHKPTQLIYPMMHKSCQGCLCKLWYSRDYLTERRLQRFGAEAKYCSQKKLKRNV